MYDVDHSPLPDNRHTHRAPQTFDHLVPATTPEPPSSPFVERGLESPKAIRDLAGFTGMTDRGIAEWLSA
jgi:hypothetical protein